MFAALQLRHSHNDLLILDWNHTRNHPWRSSQDVPPRNFRASCAKRHTTKFAASTGCCPNHPRLLCGRAFA